MDTKRTLCEIEVALSKHDSFNFIRNIIAFNVNGFITTSGGGDPERIYEHDIVGFVDIDQHVVAEVIFENGSFCFRDKEGQVYYPCDVQCVSVLGNKFDNPGLIKELKGE